MNIETIPLAELHAPKVNTRIHPEKQIDALMRAVRMFGQTRPVVIDEQNVVLAGNGLLAALRRMKQPHVQAVRVVGLTPSQKAKLMLSDNRIYELGFDDSNAIVSLLREIGDLDVPGFDPETLKTLTSDDATAARAAMDTFGVLAEDDLRGEVTTITCEYCGKDFVLP